MKTSKCVSWLWLGGIYLVGCLSQIALMRSGIGLQGTMLLLTCVWLPVVPVLIGWIGGRSRSWAITATGVLGFIAAVYFVEFVWDLLYRVSPPPSLLPDKGDLIGLTIMLVVQLAIASIVHAVVPHRRSPPPGYCQHCSYNLTGNASGICPECGTPIAGEQKVNQEAD